uniref:Plethodontid modulating factor n=1 Tax=Panagrolaimus davidi TaxID=227884 RepID=A0A914QHX3_9BILA
MAASKFLSFLILASIISFTVAVLCRTGVDTVEGPTVDCLSNQCLNTTSPESTVYSCDYSKVCDMIRLKDECIREGDKIICCCYSDKCNFGSPFNSAYLYSSMIQIRSLDAHIHPLY